MNDKDIKEIYGDDPEKLRQRVLYLEACVRYSIALLENYRMSLNDPEWHAEFLPREGQSLADLGFCQGRMFEDCIPNLEAALEGEMKPRIAAHIPAAELTEEEQRAAALELVERNYCCSTCGAMVDARKMNWRHVGNGAWEHRCPGGDAQAGRFPMIRKADYDKLKASGVAFKLPGARE